MLAALVLPRLLPATGDRAAMLGGAALMLAAVAASSRAGGLSLLLPLWSAVGFGFAATQIPIGRILTRSARPADRPAVFAAQFALSHAAWLVAYPLAGWSGTALGLPATAIVLATLGAGALAGALALWPSSDPEILPHDHPDLPPDHPHLREFGRPHAHAFVIDGLHRRWPRRSRAGIQRSALPAGPS